MKLTLRPLWLPILMVGAALLLCLATAAQAQLTSSAPPAPQNVTGHTLMTTDGYAVLLVWDDPDDDTITGYEWRRVGSVSTTEWTTIAGNVSDAALPGLRMGVRYHFELRSVHDDGTRSGTAAIRYEMSEDEIVYQVPAVVVGEDLAAPPADEPPSAVSIGPSTRSTPSTADQTGGRYNYVTVVCSGDRESDPDVCNRVGNTLGTVDQCTAEDTTYKCPVSYVRPQPDPAVDYAYDSDGDLIGCRDTSKYCKPNGEVRTDAGSDNDPARFEREICWDDTTARRQWWTDAPPAGVTLEDQRQTTVAGVTTTWYLYAINVTARVCNVHKNNVP